MTSESSKRSVKVKSSLLLRCHGDCIPTTLIDTVIATLRSSSPGPAVHPNFPPSSFTLFQRIFGAISVITHEELLVTQATVDKMKGREKCYTDDATILCS